MKNLLSSLIRFRRCGRNRFGRCRVAARKEAQNSQFSVNPQIEARGEAA